jgi:hypothetical protein
MTEKGRKGKEMRHRYKLEKPREKERNAEKQR